MNRPATLPFRVLVAAWACLALAFPTASASTTDGVPNLPEIEAAGTDGQRMVPLIQRFAADLGSLQHVHDIQHGRARHDALQALHAGWRTRLAEIPADTLDLEDRVDHLLFSRELDDRERRLAFARQRYEEAAVLLPGIDELLDLLEQRRALVYPDGRRSADLLDRVAGTMKARRDAIEEDPSRASDVRPVVAFRAAAILDATRNALAQWQEFHDGYDPQLTWWTRGPHEALDAVMQDYARTLRGKLAGADDPETIIGDPIGRQALIDDLDYEMIPYTPEELVRIAERELEWIRAEMRQAASELGYADWRDALEYVKTRHPAPGEQPRLVKELADEAVAFLRERDLVTIPDLSTRDWRMNMLSPERQLQAPFFLGGVDVWVAYPTADMPHEKRVNSLRGNNRHFSRAVVHHELIPGHHLQHFMNQRYQAHRNLFRTPFWTEGWALYWEFRLYELGFAATPEDRIGMLFWRAHRAARIQFSLGFHLGTMTPQQAIELLVDNGHERENAAAEVRRSFAGDWPAIYQAAYMLGGLQFQALHRDFVESGRMSERDFHDFILQGGVMPVEMVRARLQQQAPGSDFRTSWRFYDLGR
ncbi:DUF885 family protein [Alkalisalibacterium limincola]|nr:DUF885 family protein [Alkalisalibacterium limincola]